MAARVFSVEYRSAVAQRILNGESVMALNAELKIKRSVLYRWRDAYRKFGQDGFKKTRGRPPGAATTPVDRRGRVGRRGRTGCYMLKNR